MGLGNWGCTDTTVIVAEKKSASGLAAKVKHGSHYWVGGVRGRGVIINYANSMWLRQREDRIVLCIFGVNAPRHFVIMGA